MVIDTTGDLDVAAAAGAPFIERQLHRHDRVPPRRRRHRRGRALPSARSRRPSRKLDRAGQARAWAARWDFWWLKTPLPGIVWCNCPHMTGFDAPQGRGPDARRFRGPQAHLRAGRLRARATCRASQNCFVVDVAPQTRRPPDAAAGGRVRRDQGRRAWTACASPTRWRAAATTTRPTARMLPQGGRRPARRRAATTRRPRAAQKMSREIPPCMSMGQSAGVAAALALRGGHLGAQRRVDAAQPSARQGAAPRAAIPATCRPPMPTLHGEGRMTAPDRTAACRWPASGSIDFTQVMMGPGGDADAGRLRRRRDQGRAAAGAATCRRTSFPNDPAGLDGPVFCALNRNKRASCSTCATPSDKAAGAGADRRRRRGRQQLPRRRDGAHGLRLRGAAGRCNPRIIYAVGTGFGPSGPYAHKGGQDVLAQAHVRRDGAPLRRRACRCRSTPTTFADYSAGMHLVQGILLALLQRAEDRPRPARSASRCYDSMLATQTQEAAIDHDARRARSTGARCR